MRILLGNVFAFISASLMIYYGTLKQKKKILYFQTIQIVLAVISNIILGGITGAIINTLSIMRNILCYREKLGLKEKIILTILSTILSLKFNNMGYIGLLPLISTVCYIWLMSTKSDKNFKLLVSLTMLMWFIYDFTIKSYVFAMFDFISIVVNVIILFRIK